MNLYVSIGSPFIGLYWLGYVVALIWIGFELITAFVTERHAQMPLIFRNIITFRDTNYGREREYSRYHDPCADITVWSWIGTLVIGFIIGFMMIFLWPFFTGWALLHALRFGHRNKEVWDEWQANRAEYKAKTKAKATKPKKKFHLRGTEE